jgi:hypothetical protein
VTGGATEHGKVTYVPSRNTNADCNSSIQFFIYLRAELNSQWPITESARIQTTGIRQHRTKKNIKTKKCGSSRLFKLKHGLLKISVDLQTALAADTHLAERQWLKEQLNMLKLRMFRLGARMPTVSKTEGQYLVPLKTFIKNNASK